VSGEPPLRYVVGRDPARLGDEAAELEAAGERVAAFLGDDADGADAAALEEMRAELESDGNFPADGSKD
jgi:hypothetical protein